MSYASSSVPPTTAQRRAAADATALDDAFDLSYDRGSTFDESRDWNGIGVFGAGLAIGAILGAGAALLFAPHSGEETRTLIVGRARSIRDRTTDAWDDLGVELHDAARHARRQVRRGMQRGRWAAADAFEG